jgi:hypothetical protein
MWFIVDEIKNHHIGFGALEAVGRASSNFFREATFAKHEIE